MEPKCPVCGKGYTDKNKKRVLINKHGRKGRMFTIHRYIHFWVEPTGMATKICEVKK